MNLLHDPLAHTPLLFGLLAIAFLAQTACEGPATDKSAAPPRAATTSSSTPTLNAASASASPPATSGAAPIASASSAAPGSSASSDAAPLGSASAAGPCPPDMALAGRTCVDRWEAHLVQLRDDGQQVPHSPYERPVAGVRYAARSTPGSVPQAYVNREEAAAACANASKRLCSLLEWYEACRGTRGTTWPYGNRMERGKCNASKPHLLSRLYGTNPRGWKYDDHFNDPKLNQEPGFLARTGEYGACASDYGVYDMVGNLHEWVTDTVGPSLATKIPLRDDIRSKLVKNRGKAIFMGGFFSTTSEHGRGCGFVTIGHEKTYHDYSTGFRCCKSVATDPR